MTKRPVELTVPEILNEALASSGMLKCSSHLILITSEGLICLWWKMPCSFSLHVMLISD